MLVIPLGLGTKLRRLPVVTLAIAALWLVVFLLDASRTHIMKDVVASSAKRSVRDASRNLFVQYCLERKGDVAHCRRYSVLVWTGFPGKQSKKLELAKILDEQRLADKVRKELDNCTHERRCFVYKDIVWKFMEGQRTGMMSLAHLKAYKSYKHALAGYRRDLVQSCRRYDCLVRGNVNAASLLWAQARHGGFVHLFSNLIAFLIFGIYVEQRISRLLYLGSVLAGGTIGMAVHTLYFGASDMMVLGGSANVSAVMGMFFVFFFHKKMRFQVWLPRKLYLGTPYWADVKFCFPLLFVLSDVTGGLDSGFVDLVSTKVAHFAHLSGLLTGVIIALLARAIKPLPAAMLYEGERQDVLAMERSLTIDEVFTRAGAILHYNPENVHAMTTASSAFLRHLAAQKSTPPPRLVEHGRRFLIAYLPTLCAVKTRRGALAEVCSLLSLIPAYMPFKLYLSRLGQVNTLKLGDYALAAGDSVLAFKLYDSYVSRFPLAVKGQGVEETAAQVVSSLPPTGANVAAMESYLLYHSDSLLAARVGAWLTNAKTARSA